MTPADRISVVTAVDERLKTTSICLGVAYGARHDPPDRGGLAHVLEHLLMSAPVSGVGPLVQHIEGLGGSANAETGLEQMLFYAQVDAEDAEQVVDLLLRAVLAPELDAATLDTERAAVLQELAAAEADPMDTVQDAFLTAIFPGHPLGRPVGGTVPEIAAMDLEGVARGHRDALLSSPMALAIVGPRIPGGLQATGTASRSTGTARPAVPLGPAHPTAPAWPDEFAWVAVGGRSTGLTDENRHRYVVLANLLGGCASSVLYRELRVAAGLAYSFQAWDRGYTEAGAWRVLIGVESGNGPEAVAIVKRELDALATAGPTDTDLDAARRHARMSLLRDTETPLEHARLLASRALFHAGDWDLDSELREIATVTRDDVREAASSLRDGLVTVVRPEAK
ncbi:pitrilysin family protein [Streptomyces sp. NPDC026206]|uniref:M16 family metallopeptidase n=1 Tax=Streptomyces sp. NPDC026206 TaxID=3157089 RepID=UPI00340F50EB